MNEKILIIEDDEIILRFISIALKTKDYEVIIAKNGLEGINYAMNALPTVILLDLGLPDIDGIEVLKQIRLFSNEPIIVVSARDKETEKIEALDLGANDYLTKPFNLGELMARIRVALRMRQPKKALEKTFEFGDLTIDFDKRKVVIQTEEVHLTPIEYRLLLLLIEYQGKVLTHSFIQKSVWGYDANDDYQSLRVFMASIRRKIETDTNHPQYIITEIGVGYRFSDEWVPLSTEWTSN